MASNHLVLCHPLLLLPSIFPSIRVFLMSQFFASGGQSIGASASPSVLPMNIQDWLPLGWTGLISLLSKGLSRVFSNTTVQKPSILWHSAFFLVQFSHPYMSTRKTIQERGVVCNIFLTYWYRMPFGDNLFGWHFTKYTLRNTVKEHFNTGAQCTNFRRCWEWWKLTIGYFGDGSYQVGIQIWCGTHLWTPYLWQRRQEYTIEKRQSL